MIASRNLQRHKLTLVVDDQEINRDALEMILADGYEFIHASDGIEAMEMIRKYADRLSIVLLDLIMPRMNGFEVLKQIKSDELLKHIPVIVMTAENEAELKALKLGAADFITKPFDFPEIIIARVERIIELSEGKALISAAEYDRLTGLYNRSFFLEYANRLFHYSPGIRMDAIEINIEQFHTINAVNGREFGDEILRTIGAEIKDYLSEAEGIASRFEADRFDIYCAHQTDYQSLLERLQEKMNAAFPHVSVHLRMGVKPCQEGVEPILLFDRARAACNMVRGDYQKPLLIYDEDMHRKEILNQHLLDDLKTAVTEKQLTVFYQPKYAIQGDQPRLRSAEALVRWNHPELGMISPGQFVPLFEGNGLISIVDDFVWREAAQQVSAWHQKYGIKLPVSVNLSRADVFDPTLVSRLVRLVRENGLEFRDLLLEVTESAYTDQASVVLETVNTLRKMGFGVEMDDFGSGYSSLNMLSDMPIDILKMDMKFVRNIESSETDLRLVKLILDIAKYLRLLVVAEGVETEGQLSLLKDAGCDLVQGYYFSRPLPPQEFEKLIEKDIAIEKGRKK